MTGNCRRQEDKKEKKKRDFLPITWGLLVNIGSLSHPNKVLINWKASVKLASATIHCAMENEVSWMRHENGLGVIPAMFTGLRQRVMREKQQTSL